MRVYIEYVIIDNMIIDGLILWLSSITLKMKPNAVRIFLSALIGTVGAIALSFIKAPVIVGFAAKLLLSVIMALTACGRGKSFFRYYLIFIAYTFIMGGAVLGILFMLKASVYDALTLNYASGIPVGLIVGCIGLAVLLSVKSAKLLYARRVESSRKFVEVVMRLEKEYRLKGLVDSGNLLTYEGKPVFFAVSKRLKAVVVGKYAENMLCGEENNARIPFSTVSGESVCLAIKPELLTVDGKAEECYVAFGSVCSEDFDIIV